MTHDELLAEIDERTSYLGNIDGIYTALRAVVELHKPMAPTVPLETHDDYWYGLCDDCLKTYPCPTIQAIEKKLK